MSNMSNICPLCWEEITDTCERGEDYFCTRCHHYFTDHIAFRCPYCEVSGDEIEQDDKGELSCTACGETFSTDKEEGQCPHCSEWGDWDVMISSDQVKDGNE